MHMPVAVSTPTGTDVHAHSSQQEDSSNDEVQSLHDKVSKGLDKYLQDTEQHCALEVNYFDDITRSTSIASISKTTEQIDESSKCNVSSAKQESMEEEESAVNIPKSLKIDTGHT